MAVMITAWRRPEYLERTLKSWRFARHLDELAVFTVALGRSDVERQQSELITDFARDLPPGLVRVFGDSDEAAAAPGMHRAIAEALTGVFQDPGVDFAVAGEEDVVVSSDVLELMAWARYQFRHYYEVLCVCAHSVGGTGWDRPGGEAAPAALQYAVRLRQYFNPWVWGTWRDRWEGVLLPQWDWGEGATFDTGYDWNIATRILPRGGYRCLVPDASRSQNIGEHGGYYSTPAIFAGQQALSFRDDRSPVAYALVNDAGVT
jgi:hypothetical protein